MKLLFVLTIMLCSFSVMAGQQIGQISSLRVTSKSIGSNPAHFLLSGTASEQPSCATLPYWTFDADTPTGKNFLATLLTAQATGRSVAVYGTGECGLRPGMESVIEIDLAP